MSAHRSLAPQRKCSLRSRYVGDQVGSSCSASTMRSANKADESSEKVEALTQHDEARHDCFLRNRAGLRRHKVDILPLREAGSHVAADTRLPGSRCELSELNTTDRSSSREKSLCAMLHERPQARARRPEVPSVPKRTPSRSTSPQAVAAHDQDRPFLRTQSRSSSPPSRYSKSVSSIRSQVLLARNSRAQQALQQPAGGLMRARSHWLSGCVVAH